MPFGSYQLRFLHISDLHARGPRENEPWRRRRVLGPAWKRHLDTIQEEEGAVDLVFFTGDAAQSGKPDEFAEAAEFLESVRDILHLDADRVFTVPGNHDIDRSIAASAWERIRMHAAAKPDLLGVSRWMNEIGRAPLGFDESWRVAVLERGQAYRDWVRDTLKRPELAPAGLGYRVTVNLPGWAIPVHIVGLDTGWLCGDNADAGRLLVTENQVGRLATDDHGEPLGGLRIALMHHPLHELADGGAAKRLLADSVDLVLRGHLHQTEIQEILDPDRRLREIAAGSLYEGGLADTYGNSCRFVRMELDSQGRPVEAMVRIRSFSPRGGHWFDDDGLYRESKGGKVIWTWRTPTSRKPNPYSPWTPRADQCFGRAGIFRRLEDAFDERRSVWLVGDSRIGKSTILLAWEKRLRDRGVVAKLVSGQGPAGVLPGGFVKAVTGLEAPDDPDAAADRFTSWITAVAASGIVPVVLVDEVEAVVQSCDVRFFDRLRDLLGRVCLVFSSRVAPDEVFKQSNKVSPITNRMEAVYVGLLEPEGVESTIRLGSDHFGPGDADLMRRWCGAHSFFLQLLGWSLAEARRAESSPDQAVTDFRRQGEIHLRQVWATLSPVDRRALLDAAQGLPAQLGTLKQRGLVRDDGLPFAEVLASWLRSEAV